MKTALRLFLVLLVFGAIAKAAAPLGPTLPVNQIGPDAFVIGYTQAAVAGSEDKKQSARVNFEREFADRLVELRKKEGRAVEVVVPIIAGSASGGTSATNVFNIGAWVFLRPKTST